MADEDLAGPTIDGDHLVKMLELKIDAQAMSWRAAAGQIGVSPALLSRLRNGNQPDLPSYVKIVKWLGVSADTFLRKPLNSPSETHSAVELDLTSEVSALLRARQDLGEADKEYLEDIFVATLKLVRGRRAANLQ